MVDDDDDDEDITEEEMDINETFMPLQHENNCEICRNYQEMFNLPVR